MQVNDEIIDALARATAKHGSLRALGRALGNEQYAPAITDLRAFFKMWCKGERRNPPVIGDARWAIFWKELKEYLDPERYAPPGLRVAGPRKLRVPIESPLGILTMVPVFSQEEALALPIDVLRGDAALPDRLAGIRTEIIRETSACAAICVHGQSMGSCGILDGTVVFLTPMTRGTKIPSATLICCRYQGQILIRRYFKDPPNWGYLSSSPEAGKEYRLKKTEAPDWVMKVVRYTKACEPAN